MGRSRSKITLAAGKITDVTAVPSCRARAARAHLAERRPDPLKAEAITAQSASIDTVSGATYTSQAYAQSLQSALDAAHALAGCGSAASARTHEEGSFGHAQHVADFELVPIRMSDGN